MGGLAAAWKNLSEGDHCDQTERYAGMCEHYGMTPSRHNSGRSHENGSVESAHGYLKQCIRQALLINDLSSLNQCCSSSHNKYCVITSPIGIWSVRN